MGVLLMGQSCDAPPTPPGGGTEYCKGNSYSIWDRISDSLGTAYDSIIGGEVSVDRRSTVQIFFGQSYCTGVVISPHTVLTAAHCGYGASTTHTIKVVQPGEQTLTFASTEKLVHPDYWDWVNGGNLEARKADLMLLYTESDLPGPYIGQMFYSSKFTNICNGLVAQGFGQDEFPQTGAQLREGKYLITGEITKYLHSVRTSEAKICFGDSGGPLYADVGGQETYLAGITTTTMSADCLVGGTHVNVAWPDFRNWILDNTRP